MKWRVNQKYKKSFQVTDKMVVEFANASKDKNPVHLDESYAATTIFEKRIAHGMLLGGLISSIIGNDFPGQGTIYLSQNMQFKKPVFLNDVVDIEICITAISQKGRLSLDTNCYSGGDLVVEGSAYVIPPQ